MKPELEATIRSVPYNSFGVLMHQLEQNYSPKFGGNCVVQLRELEKRLNANGYSDNVNFFASTSTNQVIHYTAICSEGNRLYLLDPFLMQTEPINLTSIFASRQRVTVPIFPKEGDSSSQLKIVTTSPTKFKVTLYGTKPNGHRKIRSYRFDLDDKLDDLPSLNSEEFQHTQRNLLLRLVRPDNRLSWVTLDPKTEKLEIDHLWGSGESVTVSQNKSPNAFDKELEIIARELGCNPMHILTHFSLGYSAYMKMLESLEK